MNKVVYINGFSNGRSSTERVAKALEGHYSNIEAYRFSDITKNPEDIIASAKGADVITHSAGAIALGLNGMHRVESVRMIGAPLPLAIPRLLWRTVVKTAKMNANIRNLSDAVAVADYSVSSITELTAHPVRSFGKLPQIAKTDAFDIATMLHDEDINTGLYWSAGDAYYQPTVNMIEDARRDGIRVFNDLPGEHDEIILRPNALLEEVLNNRN